MLMRRWHPFRDSWSMGNHFNQRHPVFAGAMSHPTNGPWRIPFDVHREDDKIIVQASVPGIDPEAIDVSIEENILTVKGEATSEEERKADGYLLKERRAGSFRRSVRLPDTVDFEKAESHYENGVLTVNLPLMETMRAKQLKVSVGPKTLDSSG